MDIKQALATLEAFIAGGDELGDVTVDEAFDAVFYLRQFYKAQSEAQQNAQASQAETGRLFTDYLLNRR